jgi:hypothetical protein
MKLFSCSKYSTISLDFSDVPGNGTNPGQLWRIMRLTDLLIKYISMSVYHMDVFSKSLSASLGITSFWLSFTFHGFLFKGKIPKCLVIHKS